MSNHSTFQQCQSLDAANSSVCVCVCVCVCVYLVMSNNLEGEGG